MSATATTTPVIELLLVPDCPNADAARTLITECVAELGRAVTVVEREGDFPSPTIVVDGLDVTTGQPVTGGVCACRLDLPTAAQLRHALNQANAAPDPNEDGYPPQLAVGVTRDRITTVSAAARKLHQHILTVFATTGAAPQPATLQAHTGDVAVLLAELHEHDVIRLDAHGQIRAAYPFSGAPTAHTVALAGGPTVYAMCAIDALGMSAMLDRPVTITSAEPATGDPVTLNVDSDTAIWYPHTAVVLVGSTSPAAATVAQPDCCPPDTGSASVVAAADRCCGVMNFFTSPDTAKAWLAAHPDVSGVILTQGQALRLGIDIFGRLLNP